MRRLIQKRTDFRLVLGKVAHFIAEKRICFSNGTILCYQTLDYLRCIMTGIDSVYLENVIVHKVGNPTRGEALGLSEHPITMNDPIVRGMLARYFLGPFNVEEQFHFTHISDLGLNEVYHYVSNIFENPKKFTEQSAMMARFLYNKSTHARVKEGEMYVAHFKEVPFGAEYVEAIGIFKSETKETFLKVFPHGQSWEVIAEDGVNINKLDKGCLIFKMNRAEGYIVSVVDQTNKQQDAQYWVKDFLQVEQLATSYYHTDAALGMCKLFISNELQENLKSINRIRLTCSIGAWTILKPKKLLKWKSLPKKYCIILK